MVGRGGAGFQQLHAPTGVGRGGGDDGREVGEGDVVRAGAGDERAAGSEQAQRAQVEFLVATQSTLGGTFRLGEGGRVEHDRIEVVVG